MNARPLIGVNAETWPLNRRALDHACPKDVVSFGQASVADQGAGDAGEGEEVVCFAFVAAVESAAACEPGHAAFDGPAVTAEAFRRLDTSAGDAVRDPP
jgi:hypothetical protein